MEVSQIIELMKAVSDCGLTDFCYEENGVSLTLKKHPEKKVYQQMSYPAPVAQGDMPVAAPMAIQPVAAPQEATVSETAEISGKVIKCPLVGTFYAASSPDAAPFVSVGDVVKKGQVLGIVEAMKLMNEIESEYDGVVKQILVSNAELVEYDQPMFVIE